MEKVWLMPKYCKADFPCEFKVVTRNSHSDNGKRVKHQLKQPIRVCSFTGLCNQQTANVREAKTVFNSV